MPDLFEGALTPELFAEAFSGQLVVGTLIRVTAGTRTGGQLTAGTNPTTTNHSFDGFKELREVRRPDQLGGGTIAVVTIIGNSVDPLVVPEVNDKVTLESMTLTLVELLERDPAAAVYEFRAE